MTAEHAFIGLGSNIGNRTAHIRAGLAALREAGLSVGAVSSMYLTEPVLEPAQGESHHPWYVNCVARIDSPPEPSELLRVCLEIERDLGRVRRAAGIEPRTLDLDVLLYGDRVIEKPELQVPHPRLHMRRFVLLPLAEIAPRAEHPIESRPVAELLERLTDESGVWLFAPPPAPDET